MKKILIILCLVALVACAPAARVVIPDAPGYHRLSIQEVPGGMCMDDENTQKLVENLKAALKYQQDLRAILEGKGTRAGTPVPR